MRRHAEEIKHILEEHDFDSTVKSALVQYFQFSAAKYYQLRNAMIAVTIILGVGLSGSMYAFKYQDNQNGKRVCWERYNSRVAVRALAIGSSGGTKFDLDQIQDPELRMILKLSKNNAKVFQQQARTLLPIPDCSGNNPNAPSKQILDAAQVPQSLR